MRADFQQMIAGDRAGARNGRAAGVACGDQARGLGVGDQRRVVVSRRDRAEAGLRKPHTFLRQFLEIVGFEARLQDHRTGDDFHSARHSRLRRVQARQHDVLDVPWIGDPASDKLAQPELLPVDDVDDPPILMVGLRRGLRDPDFVAVNIGVRLEGTEESMAGSKSRPSNRKAPGSNSAVAAGTPFPSQPPMPSYRFLRGYAFDPSLATQLETALVSEITYKVPGSRSAGPIGEYIEVVDFDPPSECFYEPVDLDDLRILAQTGWRPRKATRSSISRWSTPWR